MNDNHTPTLPQRASFKLLVAMACSLTIVGTSWAAVVVESPGAIVAGRSIGAWSAAWWQWAAPLGPPGDPFTDTTGQFAGKNQAGPVYFLAGSSGPGTSRRFEVPANTYLLVPLLLGELSQLELGFSQTAAQVRQAAQQQANQINSLHATLDGETISSTILFTHREVSPDFSFVAVANNQFGIPPGESGIAVADGYCLMIAPMALGEHVLNYGGGASSFGIFIDETDTITVRHFAPAIVGQPTNLVVRQAGTASFNVKAFGDGPLQYQWFFNGQVVLNATNATLSLTNVQTVNEGSYYAVVSNAVGTASSAPATLDLLLSPGFVIRPLDQFVVSNGTFTVSVVLTGTPPFLYQWREQSTVRSQTVSSERTNFFTFGPVTNLAARQWRLVITNAVNSVPGINTTFNVTALADADGDGLPDLWETAFGLDPQNPLDGAADNDEDGFANREEYQAGTSPLDGSSYLKFDSIGIGAGAGKILTFTTRSNHTCTVQFADDFGQAWSRLADVPAYATNRLETVVDSNSSARRFYRVVVPRQP